MCADHAGLGPGDVIAAYQQVGTYRGAAEICGTTHKTVRRVIERAETGETGRMPVARARNYDAVTEVVAKRVKESVGRISAKRLLPVARAAGYQGSPRNFRRLVAEQKALWRGPGIRACRTRQYRSGSPGAPRIVVTCREHES